jgi:HD-GYP domain-containing protein (c-di-GMP phosphodiesterase class II)
MPPALDPGKLASLAAEMNSTQDLDLLLERILSEARSLGRAEAGSIFLVKNHRLRFCYVQNDRLYPDRAPAEGYVGEEMELDSSSLAGWAALTGETLVLDDVYQTPSDAPYSFNRSFDQATGYRTHSMLVLPLKTSQGRVVGVLEVINALDDQGRPAAFSPEHAEYMGFFAHHAAMAVERAQNTREMVLRMIRIAALRDPLETSSHVQRVGSFAASIYRAWAKNRGLGERERERGADMIRVAAMLHDVGKVAVSDVILCKPGKLDAREYRAMQNHTVAGARLFGSAVSPLDRLARDIVLRHHERWDGTGYPGRVEVEGEWRGPGPGLAGEEIPSAARIAALADVYDALVSQRVYKEPWPEDQVLRLINSERGRHFDPEVVEAFYEVYDVVQLVRQRFPEGGQPF